MDQDDVERPRLSKRFSDTLKPGEVDFKTKAGTAWSHSYLNQKPWHPLSYPNQRRKWIAEQTQAQRQRRTEEVSREYAQEQEFFRQTALITKKEKEKVEMMKAVSFMYVRPPGYDVESAKAAEVAEEMRRQGQGSTSQEQSVDGTSTAKQPSEQGSPIASVAEAKKKPRPKDVFGRALPTEEEFEVLKNAPRLETGVPARSKPFGVEVRNVRCLRCGNFGHQSGDRECPLKDAIMPNEENRLKRDDPLTAIMAHTDPSEPLKWELKQKPGMSPPRGGFDPDDPNQQIVAEDIFDEYGGFLSGGDIPELLSNFSSKLKKRKSSKKTKHKGQSSPTDNLRTAQDGSSNSTDEEMRLKREKRLKKKKQKEPNLSKSDDSESYRHNRNSRMQHSYSSDDSEPGRWLENRNHRKKHSHSTDEEIRSKREKRQKKKKQKEPNLSKSDDSESYSYRFNRNSRIQHSYSSDDSEPGRWLENRNHRKKHLHSSEELDSEDQKNDRRKGKKNVHSYSSEDLESTGKNSDRITTKEDIKTRSTEVSDFSKQDKSKYLQRNTNSFSSEDSESKVHYLNRRRSRKSQRPHTSEDSDYESQLRSRKSGRREVHYRSLEDSDSERRVKERSRARNFYASKENVAGLHHHHHQSSRHRRSSLSDDSNSGGHYRKGNSRRKYPSDTDDSRMHQHHRNREAREKRSPSEDGHYRTWKSRPKCSEDRSFEDSRRHRDTKRSQHERH